MKDTLVSLLSSRKFWVGTLTVGSVFASTILVALKIIPESALIPTITAVTATGMTFITATAFESASTDRITQAHLEALAKNGEPRK